MADNHEHCWIGKDATGRVVASVKWDVSGTWKDSIEGLERAGLTMERVTRERAKRNRWVGRS